MKKILQNFFMAVCGSQSLRKNSSLTNSLSQENTGFLTLGNFIVILNLEVLLSFLLEQPVRERKQCIISGYLGVFRSMSTVYIIKSPCITPNTWTLDPSIDNFLWPSSFCTSVMRNDKRMGLFLLLFIFGAQIHGIVSRLFIEILDFFFLLFIWTT